MAFYLWHVDAYLEYEANKIETPTEKLWAPQDNYNWEKKDIAAKYFPQSLEHIWLRPNIIALAFESKEQGKLLTLNAFKEMIDFDEAIDNDIYKTRDDGSLEKYQERCHKVYLTEPDEWTCRQSPRPIDFVYDYENDSYDLSPYNDDA